LGWVAKIHEGTAFTTSVCTGSLILSAAHEQNVGFLDLVQGSIRLETNKTILRPHHSSPSSAELDTYVRQSSKRITWTNGIERRDSVEQEDATFMAIAR